MKKGKLFLLPIIAVLSVTSCSGVDKEHSIVPMINYESYKDGKGLEAAYEINGEQLYNMLDNKYSFVLEIYQNSCQLCQILEPILDDYIKNNHYQFYRWGLNTKAEVDYLYFIIDEFPDVFASFKGTPSVWFFDQGNLTYAMSSNKFTSYDAFSSIAGKHFYGNKMYSVSSVNGVNYFMEDNEYGFIYMLDYTSIVSSEVFTLISEAKKQSDRPVLIIDSQSISQENYVQICAKFDVSITDHFAIYYSQDGVRKNVNYLSDDASSLKTWITSYLA